jgi:VCBS repeat-containing protein
VVQGVNVPYTVSVTPSNGFSDTVNFSLSGLPSGASFSFAPASVAGSGSSTLTVTTSASTPVGSYTLNITGATATLTHSVSVTLNVNSAGDFALSASPTTLQIPRGQGGTDTITVSSLQGFMGTVSLSVNGVPARVSASWNPSTVSGSGSSVLTIRVNKPARSGTYNLMITGTSGNLVHSIPLTLIVQ